MFGRGGILVVAGEVAQEPDDDGADQNDAAHFPQVLLTLLPRVEQHRLGGRDAVGGQFHDERQVFFLDEKADDMGRGHGRGDAQHVDAEQHKAGAAGEEDAGEEDVEGKPPRARHEGDDEHRDEPAPAAFDGAGGHDGRHVATEAHNHRDERLAVQSDAVHDFVHDEGGTGHVARVFEQGDEEVENHDVGQEDQNAPHAGDDAVGHQVFQDALGHVGGNPAAELAHEPFNPLHGIFAKGERALEDEVEKEKEQGLIDDIQAKYTITTVADEVRQFNFYTSTAFEGCDIFDENGVNIIVSSPYLPYTLLDIRTTVRQVCGRVRNSKYKNEVHYIYMARKPEETFNITEESKEQEQCFWRDAPLYLDLNNLKKENRKK